MGMSPTEVDRQSLWQFSAAWNGYCAAHSPDSNRLTEKRAAELFEWIDQGVPTAPSLLPRMKWNGEALSSL